MQSAIEKRTYLNDAVKGVNDDFGIHTKIANALSKKAIDADVQKTCLTIGLLGEWGSGKSVIIEKTRECLSKDPSISFSVIDVWKYNGMPLLRHVLNEIVEQLPESFSRKDIAEIKKYKDSVVLVGKSFQPMQNKLKIILSKSAKTIALISSLVLFAITIWGYFSTNTFTNLLQSISVSIFVPSAIVTLFSSKVLSAFGDFFGKIQEDLIVIDKTIVPTISPEQFDDVLNEILDKLKKHGVKKNVIVFDNIDRCRPEFSYEVLSTIKTYLDKPNCIYLIPCDDVALKHYLNNHYGSDENALGRERDFSSDFLDKLFTTYFRLPSISELSRDEFIKKCLNYTILKDIPDKDKVMQVLYYAYKGETPRQIKRFINDFISYYEIALQIDPDQKFLLDDIATFAVMISIKQIAPDYEKQLINNPELINKYNDYANIPDRINDVFQRLHFQFPKEKSALTYVYFNEVNIDQEIRSQLRDAKAVEINSITLKAILITIANDKSNKTFLTNDIIAVCNSITQMGVDIFWTQTGNYDYFKLKKELEDSLSYKSTNDNVVYPIIPYTYLESLSSDKNSIYQGLSLLLRINTFSSISFDLFKTISKMKNYSPIFDIIAENKEFDLSAEIQKYFTEIVSAHAKTIPEHDIVLIESLANNGRYELFDSSIIHAISKNITHKDQRLKELEHSIFANANVAESVFEKIGLLIDICVTIVIKNGINLSGNINEFFDNLNYLFSLNSLPISVLENAAQFDKNNVVFSQLHQLTQLTNLPDKSIDAFILGCKLFGENYIKKSYTTTSVPYIHRSVLFEKASIDIEWLAKICTYSAIWEQTIKESSLLKVILEKTTSEWRIDHISFFIYPPIIPSLFKALCDSFNNAEREIIKSHCISKSIVSLVDYLKDPSIYSNPRELVSIFDYLLSNFDSVEELLILGKMTFDDVYRSNIILGSELLNIFKKHNVLYNSTLESILATIPVHVKEKSIDKLSTNIIIESIKTLMLDAVKNDLLFDIANEAVDISRDDFIIELGLTCIEKLEENGISILNQLSEKLELIKSNNRMVVKINTLLRTEDLSSESA